MDGVFISVMENQPGNKWFTFKRSHACIWTYCCFHCWILIACGASVALLLIKDFNTLINTAYGYGFMVKMFFVIGILLLAAFNKWYFTPRLQHPKFAKHLSHAILFEMLLGLSILLTTGYITTVVGIE